MINLISKTINNYILKTSNCCCINNCFNVQAKISSFIHHNTFFTITSTKLILSTASTTKLIRNISSDSKNEVKLDIKLGFIGNWMHHKHEVYY